MIEVLRLGHRRKRDERLTTHVCLVARAFGAERVLISEKDAELEETISSVVSRFGGNFEIKTGVGWRAHLRDFKGVKVHLTMYGLPLDDAIRKVHEAGTDFLIVVGSEKVPGDVYGMVDFNIAVSNQPHSEAAALAMFLDRLTKGKWSDKEFPGGEIEVEPTERGKEVRKK